MRWSARGHSVNTVPSNAIFWANIAAFRCTCTMIIGGSIPSIELVRHRHVLRTVTADPRTLRRMVPRCIADNA